MTKIDGMKKKDKNCVRRKNAIKNRKSLLKFIRWHFLRRIDEEEKKIRENVDSTRFLIHQKHSNPFGRPKKPSYVILLKKVTNIQNRIEQKNCG